MINKMFKPIQKIDQQKSPYAGFRGRTIILLCIGYAMDFYDLTIFSVGYHDIITQLFGIHDENTIQQLRMNISNWQNLGVVLGAFIFGILGDKIGRVGIIKYSILLYSLATLLSIFTKDIFLFTALRFLAGVGLACEFSTSNVLIAELMPKKWANWCSVLLYVFGIMGGFFATVLGFLSWKIMFLIGGTGGLLIFVLRRNLKESTLLLEIMEKQKNITRGNVFSLFSKTNFSKTFKFYIINILFYILVSFMFLYPQYMHLDMDISMATKFLLLYFFIGNLLGTLIAGLWIHYLKNYASYMLVNFLLMLFLLPIFPLIGKDSFALYCILFGIFAGGTPIAWVQLMSKSFGTNIRNTATNFIFGLGRFTGILLNMILITCISYQFNLLYIMIFTSILFSVISIITMLFIKNNYHQNLNYTE